MPKIENGDRFPTLEAPALDEDESMTLPDELEGEPSVIVFYRGHF